MARQPKARQFADLGQFDIVDQGTGGGQLGAVEITESIERRHIVDRFQTPPGIVGIKPRIGDGRQMAPPIFQQARQLRPFVEFLRHQQFAGRHPRDSGG